MTDAISYPQYFFLLFGIIGFIFLVSKPEYNFLLGLFYFSARELRTAAFTRLEFAGPYLNLDDFVILIMFFSLVKFSFKYKILIPVPVIWLGICMLSSILIINLQHSFTYEVQREHKSALYFISGFFLGYNFVRNEIEFERLLKLLFIGSVAASIQYLLLTQENINIYGTSNFKETIRSVGFIGLIPALIILSLYLKIQWIKTFSEKIFYFVGLGLIITNLVLSQTRSFYISIILTIIIIFIISKEIKFKSSLVLLTFLPLLIYVIFDQYLNLLNLNELIFGRIQLLSDSPATDMTTIGRVVAVKYEFSEFLRSSIIFGNGLGFNHFLPEANNPFISWGHIGHIAYLARLGLLGFIIYSIYIPVVALKQLTKYQNKRIKYNYTKIFILFSLSLIISDWIQFWMSASYLNLTAFLPGSVIGIVWALKDKRLKLAEY